jgi:hypothetical protein
MRSNFRRRPVTSTEAREKSLVRLPRLPGVVVTNIFGRSDRERLRPEKAPLARNF